MEMVIDTGVVTYDLNGKVSISFNPTDISFVERLFDSFNSLESNYERYQEEVSKMGDKREIFRLMRERDEEMRHMINEALGADVCEPLFGSMNVFSLDSSGLPVWANLVLSIIDVIDTAFSREQKVTNPRLAKYLDKYHATKG